MKNQLQALQDYTLVSRYSKYLPDKKRRENWNESVDRVEEFFNTKYTDEKVRKYIKEAIVSMREQLALPSQRVLQFAGPAIFKHNARAYNCAATYIDRLRAFQEILYLLLCGTGCGFSVQKHHISQLPELRNDIDNLKNKIYTIPDTIEGWADSLGVLLSSFFNKGEFKEYSNCHVVFDYSLIRPKGSPFSHGCGTAPGPDGLREAHERIRSILIDAIKNSQKKLKPIQAYDIIMHASDAVLSGGVRRSATICLFSIDDDEMKKAKTGDWYIKNPQRGRSNNSIPLLRNKVTKEDFFKLLPTTRQCGEPAFLWVNSSEQLANPCQPSWATVLTPNGISTIGQISVGDEIWSENGWTKVIKKWSTGVNNVYKYKTTAGIFYGTKHHRIVSGGNKIEAKDAESIDIITGPYNEKIQHIPSTILDGLLIGDGTVHKGSNNIVLLCIGENDKDYFNSEISHLIGEKRDGIGKYVYEVNGNTVNYSELPNTYERSIPDRFIYGDINTRCSFLRGLYSANGSIVDNRITLKATSLKIIEQTQLMLSSLGIKSYITTNKAHNNEFSNGVYYCKQSYDLNITSDRNKFVSIIGFIQNYKNEKINTNIVTKVTKNTYDIISTELISEEETFDITVDNENHTYWTHGCNVSNCVEICFYCYDVTQKNYKETNEFSGVQMCNLSTQNGKKIKTKEDFIKAARAATIFGTLQAGLNEFPYLGKTSENIIRNEALLGVSITGSLENPDLLINPEIEREIAKICVDLNKELAEIIGINQAARVTCQKPEGTTSSMLGTLSGRLPGHSKRFLRRVQSNKTEVPATFYKSINPKSVSDSVWSATNTDYSIVFACEIPDKAITKDKLSAVQLLEIIKSGQINWVMSGRNKHLCSKDWLQHNISNTVNVRDNEWEEVFDFIYENRDYFTGVSLLSMTGDKDYHQAPFCEVFTPEELIKNYGDAALFTSGLIEQSSVFKDLWTACDCLLGIGENISEKCKDEVQEEIRLKKLNWCEKVKKFSKKYLGGDIKKTTYLLKDIYNWKLFIDLQKETKTVNYDDMIEEQDTTIGIENIACSGGACQI